MTVKNLNDELDKQEKKAEEQTKKPKKSRLKNLVKKIPKKLKKMVIKAPENTVSTAKTILSLGKKYKAKDYAGHVTKHTATMYIRKPYSKNGLRNEFTSRGYTGESGTPELDARWNTRTQARGDIRIGKPISKGSLSTKSRKLPSFGNLSATVGGDISMPFGIRKI